MKRLTSNLALLFRPAPDYVDAKALSAGGAAESLTVPGTAGDDIIAIFGYSLTPVYVRVGSAPTAATPVDTADGTASECNPTGYAVKGGDVISLQSSVAAIVTVSYYRNAVGKLQ